jgi:hypothetical protein
VRSGCLDRRGRRPGRHKHGQDRCGRDRHRRDQSGRDWYASRCGGTAGSAPGIGTRSPVPGAAQHARRPGHRGPGHRDRRRTALAGRIAARPDPPELGLVPARRRLGGRFAVELRAEQKAAHAGQRAAGAVRHGDGDHLRGERAVDLGAVRRGRTGHGLFLPPVPQARPRRRHDGVDAGGVGDLLHVRAGPPAGDRGARGLGVAGQCGRVSRRVRVHRPGRRGAARAALRARPQVPASGHRLAGPAVPERPRCSRAGR